MLINASCTFYLYNEDTRGYDRRFVSECYWNEGNGGKVSKSGLSNTDEVILYLYSDDVVPKHPTKDLVVKGECEFEFDNNSDASISVSYKEFTRMHKSNTVMRCRNLMFGGLPHIEISAR